MAKKQSTFPEISEAKKGKSTSWVKKNMPGSSTCDAAYKLMKSKKKYKVAVVKMTNHATKVSSKK